MQSTYLTTHSIARILGVSRSAVLAWINKGLLRAHRTVGGHRRAEKSALVEFLRQQAMPIPRVLAGVSRVLVIGCDPAMLRTIQRTLRQQAVQLVLESADGPVDGLLKIGMFLPDVVLLDAYMPGMNGVAVCARIRSRPETAHIVVVAVAARPSQQLASAFLRAGAAAFLTKPLDTKKVLAIFKPSRERDAFL